MAKATWSRELVPLPPATFTLTLSETEASILSKYLALGDNDPSPREFRCANEEIYEIQDALDHAREGS